MNRFPFVADHQRRHGVKRLCTILGIARSSFYYWRKTAADRAARQAADAKLAAKIRTIHRESDGTYGVPRITAELRDDGEHINHKRIARVMRTIGLAGVRLRRRHRTTVPDPAAAKAPDRIGRDLTAEEVNTKYVGNITYLSIGGGKFCYLATVIDLASRRLADWALADHMRTELVIDALVVAERTRGSLKGAIMHTDHGAQCTSKAFADACRRAGVPHEHGRQLGRQRRRRKLQRDLQKRDAARPKRLAQRACSTSRRVPLAPPLQHPTPSLSPRTTQPHRLRDGHHNINYPYRSRISPCPGSGVRAPQSRLPFDGLRSRSERQQLLRSRCRATFGCASWDMESSDPCRSGRSR